MVRDSRISHHHQYVGLNIQVFFFEMSVFCFCLFALPREARIKRVAEQVMSEVAQGCAKAWKVVCLAYAGETGGGSANGAGNELGSEPCPMGSTGARGEGGARIGSYSWLNKAFFGPTAPPSRPALLNLCFVLVVRRVKVSKFLKEAKKLPGVEGHRNFLDFPERPA